LESSRVPLDETISRTQILADEEVEGDSFIPQERPLTAALEVVLTVAAMIC